MESGVSFLAVEDSGKIWPTGDLKVAFLNSSRDIYHAISSIQSDFLLNVPPLTQLLLRWCCGRGVHFIRRGIARNRHFLRTTMEEADVGLSVASMSSRSSVEFIRLPPAVNSVSFAQDLALTEGISVLPGVQFYWSTPDPSEGLSTFRVALARDASVFERGWRGILEHLTT